MAYPEVMDTAEEFIVANKKSPVVEGWALGSDGGAYRLKNGLTFFLPTAECRKMPRPRWDFKQ